MPLKTRKPTTPGQRGLVLQTTDDITERRPKKSLVRPIKKTGGRNSTGRLTVRHRGGGHKRRYRVIDFKRDNFGISGIVETIEYDPNRSSRIALIKFQNGDWRYILAPNQLRVGDNVMSGDNSEIRPGNALPLTNIPSGTVVHNVELKVEKLSAVDNKNVKLGKAGRSRHLGKRPTVRGVAMAPNAHPHGGGEGRSPIGMPGPKTPWGKPALGYRTRKKKKPSGKFIVRRRYEK